MKLNLKNLTTLLFVSGMIIGCGNDDSVDSKNDTTVREVTQGEVKYTVKFINKWNELDHVKFPSNAHYSPIVFVTHKSDFNIFREGETSSASFEVLAESGAQDQVLAEVTAAQTSNSVLEYGSTEAFFPKAVDEEITLEVIVSEDFPLVSIVSMIAPSPDWVVGVDAMALIVDGDFVANKEVDLYAYDAGTEEGDTAGNFGINNENTSPKESIATLKNNDGFKAPFAKLIFTKQ